MEQIASDVLDAAEAAAYLKLNVQTIRRLARDGEIPAFRVGGSWRFRKSVLDRWTADSGREPPQHVLVVDDEPGVCEFVRRTLSSEHCTVTSAANGAEALALMERHPPDLVILDLVMPEMDGPTAIREIRARYGSMPVIILTGYPDSGLMAEAMRYAPLVLLSKPPGRGPLIEAVRTVLWGQKKQVV